VAAVAGRRAQQLLSGSDGYPTARRPWAARASRASARQRKFTKKQGCVYSLVTRAAHSRQFQQGTLGGCSILRARPSHSIASGRPTRVRYGGYWSTTAILFCDSMNDVSSKATDDYRTERRIHLSKSYAAGTQTTDFRCSTARTARRIWRSLSLDADTRAPSGASGTSRELAHPAQTADQKI